LTGEGARLQGFFPATRGQASYVVDPATHGPAFALPAAQLVVDQRQELLGGLQVALLDGGEAAGKESCLVAGKRAFVRRLIPPLNIPALSQNFHATGHAENPTSYGRATARSRKCHSIGDTASNCAADPGRLGHGKA
jgi:hypothetical protein